MAFMQIVLFVDGHTLTRCNLKISFKAFQACESLAAGLECPWAPVATVAIACLQQR